MDANGRAYLAMVPPEIDPITEWIDCHRAEGHDAHGTVAGAPGSGRGSYCFTCGEHGPDTFRILTLGDVR